MTDQFLAFLQWEEKNATAYYEEELLREKTGNYDGTMHALGSDYWQGYADAVTNALAAYAGPTPLETCDGCAVFMDEETGYHIQPNGEKLCPQCESGDK